MPGAFILDDLSAVFATADFSTAATVGAETVNGIFEDASVEINMTDERTTMMQEATFTCPTSAPITTGTTVVIDGTSYTAKTPDHDGTGVTKWYLKAD